MYAMLKDNIWPAKLNESWSLSSKNQYVKYLLCVTYVFKFVWFKLLKDKKAKTAFTGLVIIKMINESIGKSNKIMGW